MNRQIFVIGFVAFFGFISVFGQSKFSDNLHVMANYHSGFLLPEYSVFNYATQDFVRAIDVSIYKETFGKKSWEQVYKYPDYGLSFFYSSLGNDSIYGREAALTYFFRVNILNKSRFKIYNRTGIGLDYVSKTFDLKDNFLNVAIGSHVNIHFNFRFGAKYLLTDRISLNTGISFDHFSNANTSEPNLGLNSVTAYGGMSYLLGNRVEKIVNEIPEHTKKNIAEVFVSVGGKHSRALSDKYFFASSLALDLHRQTSRVFHVGTGFDLFYDSSVKSQLSSYKSYYDFQTGIHFSQSLIYNRVSLTIQEGFYIGLKERVENYFMYNRGILKYDLTEHFSVRLTMKSHLYILDYPEIGIGIKL